MLPDVNFQLIVCALILNTRTVCTICYTINVVAESISTYILTQLCSWQRYLLSECNVSQESYQSGMTEELKAVLKNTLRIKSVTEQCIRIKIMACLYLITIAA